MITKRIIGLSETIIGEEEKFALCNIIDTGWLSNGDTVVSFERKFALEHGKQNALAVSSCTTGLHLALEALGIGPGDEVIVPGVTFIATINAVLYTGAIPVPVDIVSLETPHISVEAAHKKVTENTRAVIVMHYGGYLTDLSAWSSFCEQRNLLLIEDAAHAAGLSDVGAYSDAAIFSFFANKNMTCAEGGMIFAKKDEILETCRLMRGHGMTSPTLERKKGHAFSYDITALGYNYRLDELRAAVGLVQLGRLKQHNQKRRELVEHYHKLIESNLPELIIPFSLEHKSAYHLMSVVLPASIDRHSAMVYMRDNGVQTSIHYPAYHKFTWHKRLFGRLSLPFSEEFSSRELSLPLHPGLSTDDIEYIVDKLSDSLEQQRRCGCSVSRAPTFVYSDTIKRAWDALFADDLLLAQNLFSTIACESMTPDAAKAGLVAVEIKKTGNNNEQMFKKLLQHHVACKESWLLIAEVAQGKNPELANMAKQFASTIEES